MLENVENIIKTPFRAFSMNFTFDSLYQSMSSNLINTYCQFLDTEYEAC